MRKQVTMLICICLAGCGGPVPSNTSQSPSPAPTVQTPPTTPQATPAAKPAQPLTGDFSALSTTATAITGDLVITPDRFKFEYQDYRVGLPQQVEASSASPSGKSWSELLIVPENAMVLIWPVTDTKIAHDAPNGDLCGGDATRFLVTGTPSKFGDGLQIAAFSGKPDAGIQESEMCGTYNFVPSDVKPQR